MNCKQCGYALWNLASHVCPECGQGFRPSDFEFVPNTVRYCCPGCQQVYYGTSGTGHLVPRQFDCVSCGQALDMDQMILRPADWSRERHTAAHHNPWLERKQRGVVRAWFTTIGWGMTRPADLMRAIRPDSPPNQAWWYLIVTNLVCALVGGGLAIGALMAFVAVMSASQGHGGTGMGLMAVVMPLAYVLLTPLVMVLYVLAWGAITHLLLLGARPAGGIGRTYQAMCYSSGPMALTGVPCLGPYLFSYVGSIWWIVTAILAVKESQQVTGGRATFSVLMGPVLLMLLTGGLVVWMAVATQEPSFWTSGGTLHVVDITVGQAVAAYAADPKAKGSGPIHVIELVEQGYLQSYDLTDPNTATWIDDIRLLAHVDLEDYNSAGPAQRKNYAHQVIAQQPANVVAYRMGDYVFTYHGLDLNVSPPGLWIVIHSPDPVANGIPSPMDWLAVFQVDGSSYRFQQRDLAQGLQAQNALRAQHALPPLPDPHTVQHLQPVTAP